jgi:hypothetical protein
MKKTAKHAPSRTNGNHRTASIKTTVITTGQLIPQEHGGALRNGGTNRGGTGRPPSEIRERLRGSFEQRIHVLEEIVDAATGANSDRTRAMELMAKYGIGTETTLRVDGFDGAAKAFAVIRQQIRRKLGSELAEELIQDIHIALKAEL